MKETYTIPVLEKENVDKAITRFRKKAAAYGKLLSVECGEPYATERIIWQEDDVTHTVEKVDTELVEVYDLTIESEVIQKDGYTVVAKLEHLENGNFVYSFVDQPNPAWQTMKSRCQHCGTKHYRKNTFIVRREDGSEKQVGSTCLKDYCGIDPQHLGMLKELRDLFLKDSVGCYDFDHCLKATKVYPIIDVVALAIRVKAKQGYRKSDEPGSNKSVLIRMLAEKEQPIPDERAAAQAIADEVMLMTTDDSYSRLNDKKIWFKSTLKPLLTAGYCKDTHLGYMAYAPVVYEQYLEAKAEAEARENERQKQAGESQFLGDVGQKVDVDVKEMKLITSWEGDWGYTYLYKIIDTAGNVLVWYASRCVDEFKRFRATVKAHNEREGVKQTVVTRCRAI